MKRYPRPVIQRNTNGKFNCLFPGCHRVGKEGATCVDIIWQHMKLQHNWTGKEAAEFLENKEASLGTANTAAKVSNGNGLIAGHTESPLRIGKNERINAISSELATIETYLNYCPRCSEDVAGQELPKCPRCRLNLDAIRIALHHDIVQLGALAARKTFEHVLTVMDSMTEKAD